jgi:hypothetical protein
LCCKCTAARQLDILQSQHTDLVDAVEKLKTDVAKLQSDVILNRQLPAAVSPASVVWPSLQASKKTISSFWPSFTPILRKADAGSVNIMVTGMQPKSGLSDVDTFRDLCERNLSVKPYVNRNKCRRLGRSITGKIQPLLICLNNAEIASDLLMAAKQLRRSDDEKVRRLLTPGEAQVAYEHRQQRRQHQGH